MVEVEEEREVEVEMEVERTEERKEERREERRREIDQNGDFSISTFCWRSGEGQWHKLWRRRDGLDFVHWRRKY